ncbi:toll-like receptor 4 [Physella acuta]|uniref:toll-like receptor 4 n=2 Tax=Physella acuta TaxID=109671 RepID=UPI0027DC1C33|nr:toll-like receptor 4 [Physella acuta]
MMFKKEDNTYLNYTEMVVQLPMFTKNCLIKENFSFVLTIFFTHLLCLLVLAVFFHYRWKLRYLYFIGQRRLHIGGRLVNYNPQVDVFITYDEGEPRIRQIVRNMILPFLREKNISYILGEVDFPGGDMVSHISGAITGTRKTLFLLSEDLFLDHYREYEMNLAIMREFSVRGIKDAVSNNKSKSKLTWNYHDAEVKYTCPEQCRCYLGDEDLKFDCYCFPNCPHLPSNTLELRLRDNDRVTVKCDAFENLNNLESLYLSDFTGFETREKYFQVQRFSLRSLVLEENIIAELPDNLFTNLQNLAYLQLSYNHLKRLQDGVFEGLANLKELRIEENKCVNISNKSFTGLNSLTNFKFDYFLLPEVQLKENISGINATTSQTGELPVHLFTNLQNLTYLQLRFNDLTPSHDGTFAGCPLSSFTNTSFVMGSTLSGLNLDETQLTLEQIFDSFQQFKNVQEFSIEKVTQESSYTVSLEDVLELFMETQIKNLSIAGNKVMFDQDTKYLRVPPTLKTLITDAYKYLVNNFVNALRYSPENSLTRLHFKRLPWKQNVVLLQQNKTKENQVYSKFNGLSNLKELYVSYNSLGSNTFEGMKNLRVLELSGSSGNRLCGSDLDDGWLRTDLAKLEELRMNDCKIDFISSTFYFPKNLKRLYLSKNRLTFFEAYTLRHLNMTYLDLSSNRLPGLSDEMREELKRLKFDNPQFLVDLSNNKFQFICTYVQSLHFLVTNTQLFETVDEMMFRKEDNTYLNYMEMVAQLPRLTQNCQIKEIFSFVLTIFFIHLMCLLVLAVFFHYRWKLRYLYFIGQRRLHIGGRLVNYNPQVDVFITYDEGEPRIRQIVGNMIIPFMREKNISYILGEVDFPGGDMVSHISGAITGTRKTLVLLSEDLFLDHYREYEMNLAIMREFNVRGQVIVPVFVERVDLNTYPPEVETYLRNQLYRCLVYRNNQTFWTLLGHAIRNDK